MSYIVEYTSFSGKRIPMVHKVFENADDAFSHANKAISTGSYKDFTIVESKDVSEGYKVLPPMDPKYVARKGLEGPFSTLSGKVVYYDPKEGSYYDPDTDMYMSYDEFQALDNDYKDMKDERDIPVKEADETKYGVIRYPDTAISYIKNDGNGWEHIYDKSYGFKGPVDKADLKHAKKIAKEKIPSRMLENTVNEISDETLKSYHQKAIRHGVEVGMGKTVTDKDGNKRYEKPSAEQEKLSNKRITGAAKAMNKVFARKKSANNEAEEAHGIEKKVAEKVKKVFDGMSDADKAAFMKSYLKNPKAAMDYMFADMKKMAKEEVEELGEKVDKDYVHTSVEKGKFMKSTYGVGEYKNAMFLHDLDNKGGDGKSPMLVTFAKQADAEKATKQHGGKIIKSGMGTFRIIKEEVKVTEISPDLAKRYTKAAKMDREFNDDDITRLAKSGQSTQDMHRRNSKRTKGIGRAAKVINKQPTNEGISDDAHHMERDHEVQMARSDLYKTANYAIKLHAILKGISEEQGLEGWMQAKITKAADYMSSVFHALEYDELERSQSEPMPAMESKDNEKRWKQTSMDPDAARKEFGAANVRVKKGALRNGDDMVEILETTTAGGIATAPMPMGKVIKRKKK